MSRTSTKKKPVQSEMLEYQVIITFDPRDKIYVARVPELENCHSHGRTPTEALKQAQEAIELWMETARAKKIPIPEPISCKKFSGKFVLRTSTKLHEQLAQVALSNGKSMNDLIVEMLRDKLKDAS